MSTPTNHLPNHGNPESPQLQLVLPVTQGSTEPKVRGSNPLGRALITAGFPCSHATSERHAGQGVECQSDPLSITEPNHGPNHDRQHLLSWLAGFIDGDMTIEVRADDGDVLRMVHRELGIGGLSYRQRAGRSAFMAWAVFSRTDCVKLVEILDANPLLARKASDYAIWRQAVLHLATGRPNQSTLQHLKERLQASRKYQHTSMRTEDQAA